MAQIKTRQRILNFIQKHTTATSSSLTRSLGMTKANMQYHLQALIEEGLIELSPPEKNILKLRGRPSHVYRLAASIKPDNYEQIASVLLTIQLEQSIEISHEESLKLIAHRLASRPSQASSRSQQYKEAIMILNGCHYQARWEAHQDGPRIIFRNCPYSSIVPKHPQLCQMDAYLIEHLFNNPAVQISRIAIGNPDASQCVFRMH